jgi:hypothetical protein
MPTMVHWIQSFGGPLILLPQGSVGVWTGSFGPDGDDEVEEEDTEYWRVSEQVRDYAEPYRVGGVEALVLANGRCPTTYLAEHHLIVQQMSLSRLRPPVDHALELLPQLTWTHTTTWNCAGPGVLFDSARFGATVQNPDRMAIDIAPGRHAVRSTYHRAESGDEGSLALTHLASVGPASLTIQQSL